jgi:hypothetical protein
MLPSRLLPSICASASLALAGVAGAQLTTQSHLVTSIGNQQSVLDLPTTGTFPLDFSRVSATTFLTAVGTAETAGGSAPQALAHVDASSGTSDPNVSDVSFLAGTSAFLTYQIRIAQSRPSPLVFQPPLPITATIHGEANVMGDLGANGATASAQVVASLLFHGGGAIGGGTTSASQVDPHGQFTHTFAFTVTLSNAPTLLDSIASATTSARTPIRGGNMEAMALADPTFSFDQAAFDQYAAAHGFQTFNLDNYYGFEFSPGIVPEPGTLALLLAGIALCALRRPCRDTGH